MFGYKVHGQSTFPNMSTAHDALITRLVCSLMFCPYKGVGLQGFPFVRFRKPLYLLQIPFSCVSVNCSLKGIIGDPFTTFNFPCAHRSPMGFW